MDISNERPVMVYRRDTDYGANYSLGMSRKDINGNYIYGYKMCKFKKGEELQNKTKIHIKKAFLDFYISKEKKTIDYIMITDYEVVSEQEPVTPTEEEMTPVIDDSQLPF